MRVVGLRFVSTSRDVLQQTKRGITATMAGALFPTCVSKRSACIYNVPCLLAVLSCVCLGLLLFVRLVKGREGTQHPRGW